jgi:hypothetical protein
MDAKGGRERKGNLEEEEETKQISMEKEGDKRRETEREKVVGTSNIKT